MLDHLDDLHADFLAFWGIDLDVEEPPPGPRFFAMCRRTFSFPGVMAARLAEWDRRQQPQPAARPGPTPARQALVGGSEQVREVSLDQVRHLHPDLIDHSA